MKKITISEKLKTEIIEKDKKFIYDEMEDETGMNVLESEGGMSSLGASPSPGLGRVSSAMVNGKAAPSKSNKEENSLEKDVKELNDLLSDLLL